jgi:hypothetical protein
MIARKQGVWLIAKVGEEHIMMNRQKVHHIGINEVGARIWELLETPQELDAICAQLSKEYATPPDVCRAEVDAFLKQLVEHGAVALNRPAP